MKKNVKEKEKRYEVTTREKEDSSCLFTQTKGRLEQERERWMMDITINLK